MTHLAARRVVPGGPWTAPVRRAGPAPMRQRREPPPGRLAWHLRWRSGLTAAIFAVSVLRPHRPATRRTTQLAHAGVLP